MTTLVLGASGATGRLLVGQLLDRGESVRAIVRPGARLPDSLLNHPRLSIVRASLLDLGEDEIARQVQGCTAVASCLGHTLSLKGIYGAPRRLVTEATRRLCDAIRASAPQHPVRFVLMNTAGNGNRDIDERRSYGEHCAIGLIRLLLPPHADNEMAADHLRTRLGRDDRAIEWAVVRPDTLLDEAEVTQYETHPSPTRSAIFDPGKTSRINVAHFMAELIADDDAWQRWKGRMPVIYNTG
jgi:nucleoside-diphosphate-sugar epimerase